MYSVRKAIYADAGFIPAAIKAWVLAVPISLLAGTVYLSRADAGSDTLAYVSAAVSFICAFTAGVFAGRHRQAGALFTGLVSAAVITLILLTLGFLVKGTELPADGVLSVVSFTFSGCIAGCAAAPKPRKKRGGVHRR